MLDHIPPLRYDTPWTAYVEEIERYVPGGYHPICIGDSFMNGRFKILHKLGSGGSSTVWLARDSDEDSGGLVTLKVLRADISATPAEKLRDLVIPHLIHTRATHHPGLQSIQTVLTHFLVDGPNGSHRIIVHPFAALTVKAMSNIPWYRRRGARRLRADLARDVVKQVATAVQCLHDTSVVHGDITVSNILFRASEQVHQWTDDEVYDHLGRPVEEEVKGWNRTPRGPYAPPVVVEFIENARLQDPQKIRPEIILSDFDRSYELDNCPDDYEPGTAGHYYPPEMHFEDRMGLEADIWCLGLAIFEIRSGSPLFDECMGSRSIHLRMMVDTLGKLPEDWWVQYEDRHPYFEEDGTPKSEEERERAGCLLSEPDLSLRDKLRAIGAHDTYSELADNPKFDPPVWDQGPLCEKIGVTPSEEELVLLGDLLEKMLAYRPEDRPTIAQVLEHPWFAMCV